MPRHEAGAGPAAYGFVLAGGRSSRMGTDKALVELGGRALIAHAVGILESAGLPVEIVGSRAESRAALEHYAAVLSDEVAGMGPLGGVCAALGSLGAGCGVFLPVDTPLIPASLIRYLLYHAGVTGSAVTVASVNGFPQTFPAVVDREVLSGLEAELSGGRLGCFAAFESAARELGRRVSVLPMEVLMQSGQVEHPEALAPVRWFLNINAAEDLSAAMSLRRSVVVASAASRDGVA